MGDATGAPRLIRRGTVLSSAAGLAVLASAGSGFGQAPAVNDLTMGRNGTMEINRNGSRPSGKGPEAWFTGTVRVDPLFQVGDPARLSGSQVTFEPGARTMWHTPSSRPDTHCHVRPRLGANARAARPKKSAPATSSGFRPAKSTGTVRPQTGRPITLRTYPQRRRQAHAI